jgi:putative heme-binding domain-containing protein
MYVANPITRKVQAIKIHANGPWYSYELLGDFVLSSDEWFRPVSIHFGPDGCLYIVDWYNKIISHNEVPRNHPERDKTRGRIWRVRHVQQPRSPVPDVAAASEAELLKYLQSDSTWEMRAAWHQIVDRGLNSAAPALVKLAEDPNANGGARIHAYWCLEDLKQVPVELIRNFASSSQRNFRREALRSLRNLGLSGEAILDIIQPLANDPDPQVRAEVIHAAASCAATNHAAIQLLAGLAKPSLSGPIGKNPQTGAPMKLGEAYDRDFERYLIRATLERIPDANLAFLKSTEGNSLPIENRLLMVLALPKEQSAAEVAAILPKLDRIPNEEELLRLVENLANPEALNATRQLLAKDQASAVVIESFLKVRNRIDSGKLSPLLGDPLKKLWSNGQREFAARAAGSFKVMEIAPELESALRDGSEPVPVQIASIRALREMEAGSTDMLVNLARSTKDSGARTEAINSLAASKKDDAPQAAIEFWPAMNAVQRQTALRQMTRGKAGAGLLVEAVDSGKIPGRDLDADSVDRIRELMPDDQRARELVEQLSAQFKPVLRLNGDNGSFVDSNIELEGPFTVETWVKLDPGIGNEDGILGHPDGADFNFASGHFRVFCGPEFGDRAISHKPLVANSWTHIAVTRDSKGIIRVYQNGELDSDDPRPVTATFKGLDIGRTTPNKGTAGELTEFRVWNLARSSGEIRADFDRTFSGEPLPSGLVRYYPGAGLWGELKGAARIQKVTDAPALLSGEQAKAQAAKFAHFRELAQQQGDPAKGRVLFMATCGICHSVGGQGGQIGPVLNGAGASGIETLLRSILTPNAAMEAGYRTFRVELKDGDTLDGFFVSKTPEALILRQPNAEDRRIPLSEVKSADFTRTSLMPEGLLDNINEQDVKDLFAFLKTLK